MQSRLDSISPELSELFRNCGEEQRVNAVLAACVKAASDANLHGGEVDAALATIRSGGVDIALAGRLNARSSAFDDEYFVLGDDDNPVPPEALAFFLKARAAAALAFAISADRTELVEALYEAISATADRAGIVQAAGSDIQGIQGFRTGEA